MLIQFLADAAQEASPLLHPDVPPPGDYGAAFAKMFLTLIGLVFLLLLSYWFIKKFLLNKFQRGSALQSIQVIEKRMISPKTALYLIEVDKKRILVGESQLEIKKLESLSPLDLHSDEDQEADPQA